MWSLSNVIFSQHFFWEIYTQIIECKHTHGRMGGWERLNNHVTCSRTTGPPCLMVAPSYFLCCIYFFKIKILTSAYLIPALILYMCSFSDQFLLGFNYSCKTTGHNSCFRYTHMFSCTW